MGTTWYYDKDGKKSEHSETDAYFIVKFDKGTKDKGTARKKIGKKGKLYCAKENCGYEAESSSDNES